MQSFPFPLNSFPFPYQIYHPTKSKDHSEKLKHQQQQKMKIEQLSDNSHKQSEIQSAANLKQKYSQLVAHLCQKPREKKNLKATNIPKFLFKIFGNTISSTRDPALKKRNQLFLSKLSQSKTRFDLVQLFGFSDDPKTNNQNKINRVALKRELCYNFKNVLKNKHIRNKKLYLMYCKKISHRLNFPDLIDRLEV